MNDNIDVNSDDVLDAERGEPMNELTQKNVLALLEARFDTLPPDTVLVPSGVCPICQTSPCNAVNHSCLSGCFSRPQGVV
jgi:hypothetical protein